MGTPVSITNPGFEAGSLTGWSSLTSTWLTGITGSTSADNTTSSSGSYSAKLVLNNAGPGALGYTQITQTASLSTNTYYQFSVDVKTDTENYVILDLQGSDGSLKRMVNVTDTDGSEWKTLKFNFETPSSSLTWTINLRINGIPAGTSANLWLDNVSITPITTLDKAEFTVGAIGDSQVSHLGLSSTTENDNPYSWLSSSIRKAHLDTLIVNPPLNKGVAGNTAAQVGARVQADIVDANPKPEIAYVAVGTNDAAASANVTTFKSNIISIIQTLKNGGVRPVLFKITPRTDAVNIDPYNTAITEAAEEDVTLFDPTSALTSNSDWESEWMDDSVHYNRYGHTAIGKSLGSYLKDYVVSPSAFTPTSNTSSTTSNTTPQISFSTTDNIGVDHYTIQLDSGTETTQTSPYTLSALSEGSHSITVLAYDALWNSTTGTVLDLTIDLSSPTGLSLSSPTGNTKDSTRPTFVFKKATDSVSGVSSYSVSLDAGKNRSFSTSGIPISGNGSSSYVWKDDSSVKVTFANENDSDSGNDEIQVYFKGLDAIELSEGKHTWTVTTYDSVGNANSVSADFYIDRTSPSISDLAIADVATVLSGVSYNLNITNRMPSFSGLAIDSYQGSTVTNSNGTKDTFDKVSSGPKTLILTMKRLKDGQNLTDQNAEYQDHLTKEYPLSDIKDESGDKKSARFYITTPFPLVDGYYQVNLSLKDEVGNTHNQSAFYIFLNTPVKTSILQTFLTGGILETQVTQQETVPTETEEEKQEVKEAGYVVNIKVKDEKDNPVKGAKVTIHSKVQETTTDENGIASFTGVEPGEHKVLIAYNNYEGEQTINLTGDVKEFNLNIQVKEINTFRNPKVILVIGVLAVVITILLILLIRKRRAGD
ncbi:hypothetical protein C4579_00515 [Candidatus Microgenomates bacterium]|nr:MAG: hypothetical protein C4579_00515 [Candidatus Microgenomates bacterium]